jgi:hypothetical protein
MEVSEFYLRRHTGHYGCKHFITIAKSKNQVEVRTVFLPKSGELYRGEPHGGRDAVR